MGANSSCHATAAAKAASKAGGKTLGSFKATTIDGRGKDLKDYLGKVTLVVNVASK